MGLWKVHLRDSYIRAKESGDDSKCKDILQIIGREEQKSMWRRVNRALDKPTLGAIPFVQRVENGIVVDISATDEMNRKIQTVTEKRFDLTNERTYYNVFPAHKTRLPLRHGFRQ